MPRNFSIIDADQRSPEWFAARAGRLTGSKAADAIDFLKSKAESAKRRDYRYQLAAERLSGMSDEGGFVNDAMLRGIEKEPAARAAYQAITGDLVDVSGFLSHTSIMAGCSLDGHIGDFAGIIELKCPKTATHIGYLRSGKVPENYLPQITHNLWISGAEWCDFLSFDDRLPANMQTFLVRVQREDADVAGYKALALQFLEDVDREVAALKGWKVMAS